MSAYSSLITRLGAGVLGAILLASCTVVVEEPPRPRPPRPGPDFCTREFDPVCARRGPDVRTFGNACEADRAGYSIVRRGECRIGQPVPEQRFCTREYRPVCARRGPVTRTFGNACEAESAGFRILFPRAC